MSKLVNRFDDGDDYSRELAYLQQEVDMYEEWLWYKEQEKYDLIQKQAKITILVKKEEEQLKEE